MTRIQRIAVAGAFVAAGLVSTTGARALLAAIRPPPNLPVLKPIIGQVKGTKVPVSCPASAPSIPPIVTSDGNWSAMVDIVGPLQWASIQNNNQGGYVLTCSYAIVPNANPPVAPNSTVQGQMLYFQTIAPNLGSCTASAAAGPYTCLVQ